jgi:hypothetical protein
MTTAQERLDAAQAAYDQAHATWERATIARRTAEQLARSRPTVVDTATGRLMEAQYTPRFRAEQRRLTDAEEAAWEVRVKAGEAVVLARQAAAAETKQAAILAAAQS